MELIQNIQTQKNTTMNQEQPIIVGLDIGTTKIAAIAGRKNEFGKLEILGFGRANSSGVQHGMVLNIEQTIKLFSWRWKIVINPTPNLQ
jgi:cell division protein FtsA